MKINRLSVVFLFADIYWSKRTVLNRSHNSYCISQHWHGKNTAIGIDDGDEGDGYKSYIQWVHQSIRMPFMMSLWLEWLNSATFCVWWLCPVGLLIQYRISRAGAHNEIATGSAGEVIVSEIGHWENYLRAHYARTIQLTRKHITHTEHIKSAFAFALSSLANQ